MFTTGVSSSEWIKVSRSFIQTLGDSEEIDASEGLPAHTLIRDIEFDDLVTEVMIQYGPCSLQVIARIEKETTQICDIEYNSEDFFAILKTAIDEEAPEAIREIQNFGFRPSECDLYVGVQQWLRIRYQDWTPQRLDYQSLRTLLAVRKEAEEFAVVCEATILRLIPEKRFRGFDSIWFEFCYGGISALKWLEFEDGRLFQTETISFNCSDPDLFDKLASYIESEVTEDEWEATN